MRTIFATLLLACASVYGQLGFVSNPTNPPVDGQVITRSGGTGGHNAWRPPSAGGVVTNVITTNSNSGITNLILSLSTNGAAATNIFIAAGTNIVVVTNGSGNVVINSTTDTNVISILTLTNGYWVTNQASAGSISNKYVGDVRIGTSATIDQGAGAVFSLGKGPFSPTADISAFNSGGLLITPSFDGNNGLFTYNHTAGSAPYPFTAGWDARAGGFLGAGAGGASLVGLWSYWQNNNVTASGTLENGATYTAWMDSISGSGAALRDLPAHGNEIWSNQRKPYFVIAASNTNLSQTTMSNTLASFYSHGFGVLTNLGVPLAYDIENYWLTNHRSGTYPLNYLAWNTNAWPLAASNPTNLTWYLRTNQFETWLMMYADTRVPTANNTELDIDAFTGATFWEFPNGVNGIPGTGLMQPVVTPSTIHMDITKMYQWDVGGIVLQDVALRSGVPGAYEQLWNTFTKAIQYPSPSTYPSTAQEGYWASYYPYRLNTHGMIVGYLYPPSSLPFPIAMEYSANGAAMESGTFPTEPGTTGVLRQFISMMRPTMYSLTNWSAKTIYWVLNSDQLIYSGWSYADCKDFLSGVAMTTANEWVRSWDGGVLTNTSFLTLTTNSGYISVWQDPAQNRLKTLSFGATNQIVSKTLYSGDVAVWFINEDPAIATNLTVNWSQLNFSSNYPAVVTEVWTNSLLGSYTNSFTVAVPAASSTVIKFSPANGGGLSNYVSSVSSGGGASIGPGTVNQLAKFTSTTNVGDSILGQVSTNMIEQRVAISGSWTNSNTNRIYGRVGSSTDVEALEFVAGSGIGGIPSAIRTVQGSTSTNGTTAINMQGAWYFYPTTTILGNPVGSIIPIASGVYGIGDSSHLVHGISCDSSGFFASVNSASPNFGSISGYGLQMFAAGINIDGGSGAVITIATNIGTAGSGQGSDYGNGSIAFGPSLSHPDVFIHRTALLKALAVGTNNNSSTKAAPVTIIGSPSDDNATDRAGGDLRLSGGPASGNGTNGNIVLATHLKGVAAFGYNGSQDRLHIRSDPINITTNSATTIFTFTVPTSLTCVGAKISATSEIKDGTDVATVREEVSISSVNKSGTVTATNSSAITVSALATGSAAIANTWSTSVSGTTVSVKVLCATSGISATTARLVGARLELDSDGLSVVNWNEN